MILRIYYEWNDLSKGVENIKISDADTEDIKYLNRSYDNLIFSFQGNCSIILDTERYKGYIDNQNMLTYHIVRSQQYKTYQRKQKLNKIYDNQSNI